MAPASQPILGLRRHESTKKRKTENEEAKKEILLYLIEE